MVPTDSMMGFFSLFVSNYEIEGFVTALEISSLGHL